jgi:hypothetical protein
MEDPIATPDPDACPTCHGYGTADGLPAGIRSPFSASGWYYRPDPGACGACAGTGESASASVTS